MHVHSASALHLVCQTHQVAPQRSSPQEQSHIPNPPVLLSVLFAPKELKKKQILHQILLFGKLCRIVTSATELQNIIHNITVYSASGATQLQQVPKLTQVDEGSSSGTVSGLITKPFTHIQLTVCCCLVHQNYSGKQMPHQRIQFGEPSQNVTQRYRVVCLRCQSHSQFQVDQSR